MVKRAKAPVQAPRPVPEEEDDAMEEDEEDAMGTRDTPIEVAAEVVPQEVPKPAEAKPKPEWKWPEPSPDHVVVGQPGQWGAGPPKDKRRVVAEAGSLRRRGG